LATRPTLAVLVRFGSARLPVLPAYRPARSRQLGEPGAKTHTTAGPVTRTPDMAAQEAQGFWTRWALLPGSLVARRPSSFPSCRQDLHTGPLRSTKAASQFILPVGLTTAVVRAGFPIATIDRARKSSIHVAPCRVSRRNSPSLYADRVSGTYFDHVVDCVPVASANGCKSPLPIAMTVLVHEAAANDRE